MLFELFKGHIFQFKVSYSTLENPFCVFTISDTEKICTNLSSLFSVEIFDYFPNYERA